MAAAASLPAEVGPLLESVARHDAQIDALSRDVQSVANSIRVLGQTVEHGFERITQQAASREAEFTTKLNQSAQPNYAAIGLGLTILITLCGAAWYTIGLASQRDQRTVETLVEDSKASSADRREFDRRVTRLEVLEAVRRPVMPEIGNTPTGR